MEKFQTLEVHERPREKLSALGPGRLSDGELVALVLGTGARGRSVLRLAPLVLALIDREGEELSVEKLCEISGVGLAKATAIVAALELARRRIRPRGTKIRTPADAFALVRHLGDRKQEVFAAITLSGAHEVIATRVITVGLLDRTQVHPREVFADAISDRAASIIVAHNHPSGELKASEEDIAVTRRLAEAGKILGIALLDHLVFTAAGYLSLSDEGVL